MIRKKDSKGGNFIWNAWHLFCENQDDIFYFQLMKQTESAKFKKEITRKADQSSKEPLPIKKNMSILNSYETMASLFLPHRYPDPEDSGDLNHTPTFPKGVKIIESYQLENDQNLAPPNGFQHGMKLIRERQKKVIQLRQRLKNIHHFYRTRVQEERQKNMQRNEIFINLIEELQTSHNDKITNFHQTIQQLQEEKEQVGQIDTRVHSIKQTIQQILNQSQQLKDANKQLEKKIVKKELINREKQGQLTNCRDQLDQMRNMLEGFERAKLKHLKKNRQIQQLIDGAKL